MSGARDDGGAAFPEPAVFDTSRGEVNPATAYGLAGGMTLRDYFAAKTMQSLLLIGVSEIKDVRKDETADDLIARKSYAMADAMLKARAA